jgi:colanic acid/amylovoran biosynthesis glycosyltransferase
MISMIHTNPVHFDGISVTIDRKFLTGMDRFARALDGPITSAHPPAKPGEVIMDAVTVPRTTLPYTVLILPCRPAGGRPDPMRELSDLVSRSTLVYGDGFGVGSVCRRHRVAHIAILEYDLRTQILVTRMGVGNPLRKLVRTVRCTAAYLRRIPMLRRAVGLHCNGYPIFFETAPFNTRRLLYLDSRMSEADVVPLDLLEARQARRRRGDRPLRLLYSGRYEPMKGALDAVKVAVAALDRGLDVEMHCYGQGSQQGGMTALAASRGQGRIHVHTAISYPELIERSREFDLFVCCHTQNDPSCTYLESLGAGLPIIGYANRMWRHLHAAAGLGEVAPMGDVVGLADHIASYAKDPDRLADESRRARAFALEHCFEREHDKRIADLNETMRRLGALGQ